MWPRMRREELRLEDEKRRAEAGGGEEEEDGGDDFSLLDLPGRLGQWPLGFPCWTFLGIAQVNGPWVITCRTFLGVHVNGPLVFPVLDLLGHCSGQWPLGFSLAGPSWA